jgi:hypothetical protein
MMGHDRDNYENYSNPPDPRGHLPAESVRFWVSNGPKGAWAYQPRARPWVPGFRIISAFCRNAAFGGRLCVVPSERNHHSIRDDFRGCTPGCYSDAPYDALTDHYSCFKPLVLRRLRRRNRFGRRLRGWRVGRWASSRRPEIDWARGTGMWRAGLPRRGGRRRSRLWF